MKGSPIPQREPTVVASPSALPGTRRNGDRRVTAIQVAEMTRLSVKSIYSYAQRRLIPDPVHIPSSICFWESKILDWLERQTYRPRPVNGNGAKRRTQ